VSRPAARTPAARTPAARPAASRGAAPRRPASRGPETAGLGRDYEAALRKHRDGAGEAALALAYEVGRRSMAAGLGLLDVVALHHRALERALGRRPAGRRAEAVLRSAAAVLAEALSPFEMTHRGFGEAVTALRRLNEMLEDGARRIAHALHDEAGQLLASVHLALQRATLGLPVRSRERLQEVRGLLDEIEKQLRRLSHELRPTVLDDLGLVPALDFLAQGVGERTGMRIVIDGPRDRRLPAAVETALYRVAQEALNNAARHGRARSVDLAITITPARVRCAIRDDGAGFDPATARDRGDGQGLGLLGMRERVSALGGGLDIESAPGRGTQLTITIPLEGAHAGPGSAGR
jgi:signal transduction histidine kinase